MQNYPAWGQGYGVQVTPRTMEGPPHSLNGAHPDLHASCRHEIHILRQKLNEALAKLGQKEDVGYQVQNRFSTQNEPVPCENTDKYPLLPTTLPLLPPKLPLLPTGISPEIPPLTTQGDTPPNQRRQRPIPQTPTQTQVLGNSPPTTQLPPAPPTQAQPRHRTLSQFEKQYRTTCRRLARNRRSGYIPLDLRDSKCEIVQIEGDILKSNVQFKAHAVSAELKCGRGLAAEVVKSVGRPALKGKRAQIGDVLPVESRNGSTWLFLVTKECFWHKPRHNFDQFGKDIIYAIEQLAGFIIGNKIKEIAIPHLCAGLDQMNWLYVRDVIHHFLKDVDVKVKVYHLPRGYPRSPRTHLHPSLAIREGSSYSENGQMSYEEHFPALQSPTAWSTPTGRKTRLDQSTREGPMLSTAPTPPPPGTTPSQDSIVTSRLENSNNVSVLIAIEEEEKVTCVNQSGTTCLLWVLVSSLQLKGSSAQEDEANPDSEVEVFLPSLAKKLARRRSTTRKQPSDLEEASSTEFPSLHDSQPPNRPPDASHAGQVAVVNLGFGQQGQRRRQQQQRRRNNLNRNNINSNNNAVNSLVPLNGTQVPTQRKNNPNNKRNKQRNQVGILVAAPLNNRNRPRYQVIRPARRQQQNKRRKNNRRRNQNKNNNNNNLGVFGGQQNSAKLPVAQPEQMDPTYTYNINNRYPNNNPYPINYNPVQGSNNNYPSPGNYYPQNSNQPYPYSRGNDMPVNPNNNINNSPVQQTNWPPPAPPDVPVQQATSSSPPSPVETTTINSIITNIQTERQFPAY
ncbi:myosin-G heavy chain-like [Neocloeon triangulifer]|uniref:myosin-G heavy chain-like n=1 Tax=Neocloeon triangulifer TaxID=2078957 RepID=UPI00286F4297|nr:myosin-G heavy chain-like [Neocloeon triangulifer]